MDKETSQLLAWYVNGSLAASDRDRVEDALRDDPEAEAHIGWERSVRSAMKDDPLFVVAADRGLSQVMQKIRNEAAAVEEPKPKVTARKAAPVRARAPSGTGWLARLRDSLSLSPALGMACALIVAQFAVINHLWVSRGSEEADYSGVRAVENQAANNFIRITFKPDSTEAQMSALLRANHAEIVAGPSQLGDYYVLVGRGDAPEALAQFQSDKHVESAEIVNALPSRQ